MYIKKQLPQLIVNIFNIFNIYPNTEVCSGKSDNALTPGRKVFFELWPIWQFSWWAKTHTCLSGPSVVTRVSFLLVHTSVQQPLRALGTLTLDHEWGICVGLQGLYFERIHMSTKGAEVCRDQNIGYLTCRKCKKMCVWYLYCFTRLPALPLDHGWTP